MRRFVFSFGLFVGLALSGCGQRAVNTLDQLTISVSNDGEYARPVNLTYPMQSRFLAVNGQLPVPTVASSCLASSFRVANSIICFAPSVDRETHVVTRDYPYVPSNSGAPADLLEIRNQLSDLQVGLASLAAACARAETGAEDDTAAREVESLATETTTKAAALVSDLQRNNLFIFRYVTTADAGVTANQVAGPAASARGGGSESGIVIVAGLRVSQLMVEPTDFDTHFGALPSGAKVATLTMASEHLLYFADSQFRAEFQAVLDGDLGARCQGASSPAKLAVEAYGQIASAQENQGLFSAPQAGRMSLREAYASQSDWQIFYATMTDVRSLRKAIEMN